MTVSAPRRRALGALAASATVLAAPALRAQAWPQRPLRLVVASGPGSSLDVLARVLAERLKDRFGQNFVVENRPQAGGTVAMDLVAKATDGHTLGIGFNGPLAFAPFLHARLPYDPFTALTPVAMLTSQPNVLAVHADLPVATVQALVAYARERPGQLNYASVGNASSSHLSMERFKAQTGTFVVHIPFNGAPPAALATASGETQMLMAVPTAIQAHVQAGRLRMLATTGRKRSTLAPQLPAIAETGGALADFEALAWNALVAPANLDGEAVQRLNVAVNAALAERDTGQRFANAGLERVGGTSAQAREYIAGEAARWKPIIARTGAKLD